MEKFLIFDCNQQYLNLSKLDQSVKSKIKLILHKGSGDKTLDHWSNNSATGSFLKANSVYWIQWNPTSTGVLVENIDNTNILNVNFSSNEGVSAKPAVGDVVWIQEGQSITSDVGGNPIKITSISESNLLTLTENLTLNAGVVLIFYTPDLIEGLKPISEYCVEGINECGFIECGGSIEYANCEHNSLDCRSCECVSPVPTPTTPEPVLGDPYFNNVSLLLHMDGGNDSSVFEDSSLNNITILSYPRDVVNPINEYQAKQKTQIKKFGISSGDFSQNSPRYEGVQYLTAYKTSGSPLFGFGTGDFTVEMWIYPNSQSPGTGFSSRGIFNIGSYYNGILIRYQNTGLDSLYINGISYNWNPLLNVSLNTWSHIALVRNSGNLKMFVNGINKLINITNNSNLGSTGVVLIGASAHRLNNGYNSEPFNGYIDEVRITKGIARYTSDFSPPTKPFPDFAS